MAGYFGNMEALRRLVVPEGFNLRPPATLPGGAKLDCQLVDVWDRIIAFPASDRTGAADTIRRAVRAGKPVEVR